VSHPFAQALVLLLSAPDDEVARFAAVLRDLDDTVPETLDDLVAAVERQQPGQGALAAQLLVMAAQADSLEALSADVQAALQTVHLASPPSGEALHNVLAAAHASRARTPIRVLAAAQEYQYILAGSAVLNDIRPIFASDVSDRLVAYFIAHQLRLRYDGIDGPHELVLKVDEPELVALRDAIDVALRRARVLSLSLDNTGLPAP